MNSLLESLGSAARVFDLNMKVVTIAAAAAGPHTVTGIKPGDILVAVYQRPRTFHLIASGGAAGTHVATGVEIGDRIRQVYEEDGTSGISTDRKPEFVDPIAVDDQLDNTGGTDTTGDQLLVVVEKDGVDLTSEFSITGDNEIDNTGGTAPVTDAQWEVAFIDMT